VPARPFVGGVESTVVAVPPTELTNAMNELTVIAILTATFGVWYGLRLFQLIRTDGYGPRSSSGLPRDWSPPELPSTPYSTKAHH